MLQANAEEEQADLRVSLIAGSQQSAIKVRSTYTGDQFDLCSGLKLAESGAEAHLRPIPGQARERSLPVPSDVASTQGEPQWSMEAWLLCLHVCFAHLTLHQALSLCRTLW